MTRIARALGAAAVIGLVFAANPASADPTAPVVADFYKGKTVTIQVGTAPGGGYDMTARIFAQNFGSHIPGNPTVVVQNVPGGGGMKEANNLYNTAPKDGATLGDFSPNVILEPLYGNPQAFYKSENFAWIGNMDSDIQACAVWKGAGVGIKTLDDLIHAKKTVTFGSTAPSGATSLYPLFLKNALGAPAKVINGYTSTKEINLAMARGELDGTCGITPATPVEELQSGNLDLLVHMGMDRQVPLYGKALPISDAIKTPEMRKIAELVFNPGVITRPLAAPPGTPKERVAALRKAFTDNANDPLTAAAAKKANMTLHTMSGEEVEKMVSGFLATPPELVKKAFDYTHVE
jgi:tripartite-type tricarboxylate transporter receptor subunit TctC